MGIESFPDEYVWAKSWQHLGMSHEDRLLLFTVNIAMRAQSPDYELFRPFLRKMMHRHPVPDIFGPKGHENARAFVAGRRDQNDVNSRGISDGPVQDSIAVADVPNKPGVSVRVPAARSGEGRGAVKRKELSRKARLEAKHK